MATSEDGNPQPAATVPGVDPYIEWVTGIGRSTYFLPGMQPEGQERMPLLLRLKGISAEDFVSGKINDEFFIDGDERRRRWTESFQILSLETATVAKTAPSVLSMATDEIRETILSQEGAGRFVESVTLGRPLDTESLPPLAPPGTARPPWPAPSSRLAMTTPPSPPAQPVVVMGIIDDGIAFAHERFRVLTSTGLKTRVECWWLQDGKFDGTAPVGRALDKAQIDAQLAACTTAGHLDEEKFYRSVGLLDYTQRGHKSAAWRVAHGTHIMDLACGFDPADKQTDRPIACVQLPTRVTARTSGGHLGPWVNSGIWFIIACALKIRMSRPVAGIVINISYGVFAGPHDGTSHIEQDIEDRISECLTLFGIKLRVILPAGNSFLGRTHAQFQFALGDVVSLPWRVLPDDQTPSYVEIWLPGVAPALKANSRITLKITAPDGTAYTITEQGGTVPFGPPGGHFGHAKYSVSGSLRGHFTIKVKGTTHIDGNPPDAPAGAWTIELTCTKAFAPNEIVQAWVQRDDSLYGFPLRGRQSYFDEPTYDRFDLNGCDEEIDDPSQKYVRRESTLNAFATGASPIVVGGYLRKEEVCAKYSAGGTPVVPPPTLAPDAMMVSEDSRVHTGVLAAGSRGGSVVAMGGTSVAAPQLARKLADDLAVVGGLGDKACADHLADVDDPTFAVPMQPRHRGGHGRIISPPIVPLKRYDP